MNQRIIARRLRLAIALKQLNALISTISFSLVCKLKIFLNKIQYFLKKKIKCTKGQWLSDWGSLEHLNN